MEFTNVETTTKHHRNATHNGYSIKFEFETVNNVLKGGEIQATALKTGGSITVSLNKNGSNSKIIAVTGVIDDYDLYAALDAEFAAIKTEFAAVPPAPPTEG